MKWEIDPFHTLVEFSVKHLMINTVKGRFTDVHGAILIDPQQIEQSFVQVQIKTASIFTGVAQRDAHLRSADFFEASTHPFITFESTHIKPVSQNQGLVVGNLSIRGVTKQVSFETIYGGRTRDHFTDAWRVGFEAATTIDRRDFGMLYDQNKMGIYLVGYAVYIEIHAEAILQG